MAASRVAAGPSLEVISRGKYEVGTFVVVILSWLEFRCFGTEWRLVWWGFIPHRFILAAFVLLWREAGAVKCVSQQILWSGFGGRKAPSSMGKISTAEVLRLRARNPLLCDRFARRFAQG
jgi:hypothetical protein